MLPEELQSGTGIRYYEGLGSDGVVTQDFEVVKNLVSEHLDASGIYTHAAGLYMLGIVRVTPDNADVISALVAEHVACETSYLLALDLDSDKVWDLQVFTREDVDRRIEDIGAEACQALPYWFDLSRERKLVHARLEVDAAVIRAQLKLVQMLRAPKADALKKLAWAFGTWAVLTIPAMFWSGMFWSYIAASIICVWRLVVSIKADARCTAEEGILAYRRTVYTNTSLALATLQYADKFGWAEQSEDNNTGWFHTLEPANRYTDFNDALKDYLDTIHVTWEI